MLCSTSVPTFERLLAAAELAELRRREQEAGIMPEPALDRFMEAMSQQASVHPLPFATWSALVGLTVLLVLVTSLFQQTCQD